MEYTRDNLNNNEIIMLLNKCKNKSIPEAIEIIWKEGYTWGYEIGYEDASDKTL